MKLGIRLLLFVIFIMYMLGTYQITEKFINGQITTKYKIDILPKEMAVPVFKDLKNIGDYNEREMDGRSNFKVSGNIDMKRREMYDMYLNNVMDFNQDEVQSITDAINYLFENFKDRVPLIKNWNLIKLNSDMDWGFPHTIGNYIILSSGMSNDTMELARTLFHEQLHIIQRKEPNLFKEMYEKQWKFKQFNLPNDEWINKFLVHNPDSNDYYIYKLTDELYILPLATTYNQHHRLTENAIFLNNNMKILAKGEEPYVVPLRQVVDYNTRFYNSQALYHPNEIFATILTDMLFNNLSVSEIDQNAFTAIFKELSIYF